MDDDYSLENFYNQVSEDTSSTAGEPTLADVPLFPALLCEAVRKTWPGDSVMAEFVEKVALPLSDSFGHVAAKGGDFVEERRAEGKSVDEHYLPDQSMRAHLINGLFPAMHVARALKEWGAPQFRFYDDRARRILIAGYVLHDFLKLPGVDETLRAAGFSYDRAVGPEQIPLLEEIFGEWCSRLELDSFLASLGGSAAVLHDLIYVACNTQTRWGTLRNLRLLDRLSLAPAQLDLAEQLSRLADLLAYVAPTPPQVASHTGVRRTLATLSDGMARLAYHHLADNRGVLANFIHNAALAALSHPYRLPLLYAPSGVVYLEHKEKSPPPPAVEAVAEETVGRIRSIAGSILAQSRTGIRRDGKGMKYADYYWLFFDLPAFVRLGVRATLEIVHPKKEPSAGKRFAKMIAGDWMETGVDLDLPNDIRVDQLAEWCFMAEKQVTSQLPAFNVAAFLLKAIDLDDLQPQFAAVPRDNRAGGVGYHWYFAAGHYLKRHPGLDPQAWQERIEALAAGLADAVQAEVSGLGSGLADHSDWDNLRDYITCNLSLPGGQTAQDDRSAFQAELLRYTGAKRRGRGTTQVCALCSSPYRVDKQREAAVLFAPQVYSNKRPLHSTDAIRDICSICSMEMMLRQILMNRSAASGGDFEGRRLRYLYFYPTYFFTPETLSLIRRAYLGIKRMSLTDLRKHLVDKTGRVDLSAETLQRLEPLLLTPQADQDPAADRYLRLHFPETEPVTFYFIGVPPPGRDAKDAEAWVHPALLALLLPLCLDVKVVASEASLPLMLEANEINETVFLDAPHAAVTYLTNGQARLNIDQILPTLQRLLTGYLIHVDANSRMGAGGYDYRWQDLPALARALAESPLYVFHYLKKWQRQQQLDKLPGMKVRQYLTYLTFLNGDPAMSHARKLTQLYRQFYRSRRYNANSILRPVSIAARVILEADPRLFPDADSLCEAVFGALRSFSIRARNEGLAYVPKGSKPPEREQAMRDFAAYFVQDIFFNAFQGDKSALRGKQLNLLKNACEVIYLQEAAQDRIDQEEVQDPLPEPEEL